LIVIAAFIFYGLIVSGVIILRIKNKDLHRPYKTYGYPFVPIIFLLFCFTLLIVSVYESPWKSVIGLGLILSGLPFYYYWKKKSAE
ncbi:MAG: amino acid transporter, partial [Crocinitomicaceae bacterium]